MPNIRTNKPLRVMMIEPSGAGGLAHYTYCLVKALAEAGVACDIVTSRQWNLPEIEGSVRIHRIFRGSRTSPIQVFKTLASLRDGLDIVHWHSTTHPYMLLALMILNPLKRLPWVNTVHNVLPHEQTAATLSLYQRIYQRIQGLIFHSEFSRQEFQSHFPQLNITNDIIPLGEFGFLAGDAAWQVQLPSGKNILFFGNIRPYKGLDILIEAFAEVLRIVPEATLTIAGQALQPFQTYLDQINRLDLMKSIHLNLGYHPDSIIPDLFAPARVVALPYRSIDQSGVLLLALALGKAVVASQVGGISEVIRPGETGILTESENSHALADALIRVLQDDALALSLGQAAQQDIKDRFSWEAIAQKTIDFYQRLLKQSL